MKAFFARFLSGAIVLCAAVSPALAVDLVATSTLDGSLYYINGEGQKRLIMSGLGQPHGVAVADDGSIYVAEVAGDRIRYVHPNGLGNLPIYNFDSEFDNPEGIARSTDGNLYVAGTIDFPNTLEPNALYQILPNGVGTSYATVGPQENLGVAVDGNGIAFVTDLDASVNGSIWRVTPNQQSVRIATNLGGPWGVAIAPGEQSVFVADNFGNRILNVTYDGQVSLFANIAAPLSLATDDDGNVYVGQDNQIIRIAPGGQQTVIATGFAGVRGIAVFVPEPASASLLLIAALTLISHPGRFSQRR